MSAEASDMSSYLLMGIPGLAYLSGMSEVSWTIIGLAAGTYLNWLIVARRLRRYSEVNDSITIPEFFSNRYHDKKNVLRLIAAIWIIIFFVPYTASGFAACGKLFHSLLGVDYHVAMVVSAIVIIAYTTLGGFLAASTTDFIQSIIMSLALLIILIFGVTIAGGMDAVISHAKALPGYFSLLKKYDAATHSAVPFSALSIVSTLAWGLGYFGMPHILLRFMAIEDDSKLKLSRRVASIWALIAMAVSVLIGIIGLAASANGALKPLAGNASETIIVEIASLLSTHGIFFACVAASSSVTSDILVGFFHKKIEQKKLLLISRISLVLIASIGMIMAWDPNSSVFKIVSFAWAGFGASFGPTVLLALYWRRSNFYGAFAGMLSGGIMVFIWKYLVRPLGGNFDIYELLPAFLVAILINIIVSLLTKKPDDNVLADFDQVSSMSK